MSQVSDFASLRIALVHDYLNQQGGAENVLEVLAEMFPGAPIYTSVYDPANMPERWRERDIRTSFMQRISPRMAVAKALLPLYPTAFETFDLREYDLVLSNTTTFAKGVLTRPHTCHVCYCHNPTRFLWMYQEYLEHEGLPTPAMRILPWLSTPLRVWDFAAAQRVDYFLANSRNAARRIAKYYRREADVIAPPIDSSCFDRDGRVDDYFLVVSRLQPYKRIDLAVEACSGLRVPLHVVGDGPDRSRLERIAGPTVTFRGRVTDEDVRGEMARCRAVIFPGEEDFGLVPLEAQASGRPVIAFRGGGALETVIDGKTGLFFDEATPQSLAQVISDFDDHFQPDQLQAHARSFDKSVFKERMYELLARRYEEYRERFVR